MSNNKYIPYVPSIFSRTQFADIGQAQVNWENVTDKPSAQFGKIIVSDGQGNFFPASFKLSAGDFSTLAYSTKSKSVNAQDTAPTGVTFSPDGVNMYVCGQTDGEILQYVLTTPWDVSTAAYLQAFDPSDEDLPYNVQFSPDGKRMFMAGVGTEYLYAYELTTAWDISTASYLEVRVSVPEIQGFWFRADGLRFYYCDSISQTIKVYYLSTPWDISTAEINAPNTFDPTGLMPQPKGVAFNAAGTQMFIISYVVDLIYQYDLGTPWDLTTAVAGTSLDISTEENVPTHFCINHEMSRLYLVGTQNKTVYQYNMTLTLDMGGNKVTNAGDPDNAQDLVTKAHFDANAGGGSLTKIIDNGTNAQVVSGAYLDFDGNIVILRSGSSGIQIDSSGFYVYKHLIPFGGTRHLGLTSYPFGDLKMTGTIAETGNRVTQAYFTDHTTTNAETVDSDMTLKDLVARIEAATALLKSLPQAIKYTWKPFELHKKNVLDEAGNPIVIDQEPELDAEGNQVYETVYSLDEAGKKIILEPAELNEQGEVTKQTVYQTEQVAKMQDIYQQEPVLMDALTPHFGFSAQEMQEAFPELVKETPAGSLTIAYTELIPFLIEGFKELEARTTAIEAKQANFEERILALEQA